MAGWARRLLPLWVGLLTGSGGIRGTLAGEPPTLQLEVDAPTCRAGCCIPIEVPCRPGKLADLVPKWVPGTHGPCGPVENVAGLRLETPSGKTLAWARDEIEPYRVECDVPAGVRWIAVRLDTLCNEPAVRAAGYLSYGNVSVRVPQLEHLPDLPRGPVE